MDLGLIAVSALVCIVLLALDAQRRERATWRDWELLLTPKGERTYRRIERRVRDNAGLVDLALGRSAELGDAGHDAEARRLLGTGAGLLSGLSALMSNLLLGMARFSRMAWAMAGVPSLPARELRTPALRGSVYLNNVVQPFLVTAGERFRLRATTLRRGFALLAGVVARACERLQRPLAPHAAADWAAVAAARSDVAVLTDESLVSLRVLLTALSARPRAEAVLAEEPRA